jgi:signal transduction histidine kinase
MYGCLFLGLMDEPSLKFLSAKVNLLNKLHSARVVRITRTGDFFVQKFDRIGIQRKMPDNCKMFTHRSFTILALLWGLSHSLSCAEPLLSLPAGILTNAAQVRALDAKEAARHLPVHLRGVVIGEAEPGGNGFALQDETSGIYLTRSSDEVARLHPGDEIEVTGTSDPGSFAPSVIVTTMRKLGVKPLPEPRKITFGELLSGRFEAQWVELVGIVRYCEPSPNDPRKLRIELATGEGRLVLRWNVPKVPAPLVDAEIRVRGVCYYLANKNRQLLSPMLAIPHDVRIQIETPAPADPFSEPLHALDSLMHFAPDGSYGHRVHVRGVVTRYQPGEFIFIRDGELALRVQTSQWGELKPGDKVEISGFPKEGNYSPMLEESIFRKQASEVPPPPVRLEKLADAGRLDANLVELDGILDKQYPSWAEFFEFHTDTGMNFQALLRNDEKKTVSSLPAGGRFKVVGICSTDRGSYGLSSGLSEPGSFQILLRSMNDLTLINPPPWWTRQRTIRALAATIGISVCGCVAIVFLAGRRLREQEGRRLAAENEFALLFTERNRMAREIHDTLAQGLGSISIHVEFLKNRLKESPPEIIKHLEITRDLVRHSLADARNAIWDMRAQALQEGDLVSALDTTMKQLTEGSTISARLTVTGQPRRISSPMENDLLHIGQEALCNAIKHAGAKKIELNLDFGKDEICLSVTDDGCGFAPEQSPPRTDSFGIIGMKERVQQLRGQLLVQSSLGAGTQILATVPTSGT